MSMGKTLYHLANGKINVEEVDCTFVPVVGGVGTQLQSDEGYHSNEIANAFAKKFHGSAVQFFAPAMFNDTQDVYKRQVQCLNDYDIPLYLSHTITDIQGDKRVERVIVQEVDEKRQPIPGTEITFDVDTVLLSVGLIPENELSRAAGLQMDPRTNGPVVYENMETSAKGIFAGGNVVHVHDLVDCVTAESERAGRSAAIYAMQGNPKAGRCIEEMCIRDRGIGNNLVEDEFQPFAVTVNGQLQIIQLNFYFLINKALGMLANDL